MEFATKKSDEHHDNAVPSNKTKARAHGSVISQATRRLYRLTRSAAVLGLVFIIGAGPTIAVEVASFEIVARDGRLLPERLEVPAGVKLKLTLRNEGKAPVEFENLELRIEKVLAPDGATSVTVQPLKPGSYPVIDDFHADTGKMQIIAK